MRCVNTEKSNDLNNWTSINDVCLFVDLKHLATNIWIPNFPFLKSLAFSRLYVVPQMFDCD